MTPPVVELPGIRSDVPLAPLTSLKVGGAADLFVAVGQADDAAMAQRWAAQRRLPLRWIGGGSNLLVADHGLDGLVVVWIGIVRRLRH